MDLKSKVALVTGGTRGIGAATAVTLARLGADVAIVGREQAAGAAVREQIEALGRRCLVIAADISKPDEATGCVRQTIDTLGSVDALVHSAGGATVGGLLEVSPEAWHYTFDVHVHAIYYLCRAALPDMQKRREGAIILVSSVAGIRGIPMNLAYQVVKGTVPQFARALAREQADYNIRINCVAPGIIRTRFHDQMTAEQRQHNLEHRIPLHREGTPEEVAELIGQMVINDYITGETFVIDGGLTMRIA
jgi:NAD(P)-dependent dehydrogenase (short-subunit alcohol dehydrogenase family)